MRADPLREIERNLAARGLHDGYAREIELWWRVLARQKNDRDKEYSLHEPEVLCIGRGKEHKKYEMRSIHEYL